MGSHTQNTADNASTATAVEIEGGSKKKKEKMENGSMLRCAEPASVDGRSSSAAKAADSSYGVLTTRNPMTSLMKSGVLLKRCDAQQLSEPPSQLPPRNKRNEPVIGPVGLTMLAVG